MTDTKIIVDDVTVKDGYILANGTNPTGIASNHSEIKAVDDGTNVHLRAVTDDGGVETLHGIVLDDRWAGIKGGAIFDGTSQYYSHPANSNVQFGVGGSFSLQVFYKTNAIGSTDNSLVSFYQDASNYIRFYHRGSGNLGVFGSVGGATVINEIIAGFFTVNSNDLVVFTYDGTSLLVYKNGVLFTTITPTGSLSLLGAMYVGSRESAGFLLAGNIYSVYFYNYALTQSEVTERWNNGQPHLFVEPYATRDASQTELFTTANAVSDPNGNEANATTGFTPSAGLSAGSNIFASQSTTVNSGTYAIQAETNDTPTADSRFFFLTSTYNLVIGKKYKITFYMRHVGSGNKWRAGLGSTNYGTQNLIASVTSSDTTFAKYSLEFTHSVNTAYFSVRVDEIAGSGGVYLDNLSIAQQGSTFSALPQDAGTNGWKVILGGEISVMNATANPICPDQVKDGRQGVSTSEVVLTNTQPKNSEIKGVWVIEKAGTATQTYSIGTSSGVYDIANAVAIAANSTQYVSINELSLTTRSLYVLANEASVDMILEYEEI